MSDISIRAESIKKIFGRRLIFRDFTFDFDKFNVYGISGQNGSGKTTLLKIIARLLSPTHGKIVHKHDGDEIPEEELHNYIGFVSPYLVLYDEFSPVENLKHFSKIRGIPYDKGKADHLFEELNLFDRRNESLKVYSSGMKQRVKFIFSLIHSPKFLLMDEPTSNLDEKGKKIIYDIIAKEKENKIMIIASNDKLDLQECGQIINIEDYKN